MNKLITSITLLILFTFNIYAQSNEQQARTLINTKQQVTVRFTEKDATKLKNISRLISIDNYKNGIVTADLSKLQIDNFIDLNYNFEIINQNRDLNVLDVATTVAQMSNWDKYPSYSVYLQMMQNFATNYSNICQLDTIGISQNGRYNVVLKITDNPNIDEYEPEFLYTGQMHGNELVAGAMFLHLIDYLLSNYGSNTEITNLINNVEIWINPISNLDGMYNGGNENVSNSNRYFANGVDPNRNFPNPVDGDHSDGNPWAQETVDMMSFCESHDFVMSANTHAGAEVVNFPWDSWKSNERVTADDNWWQLVSEEYASLAQSNSPSGYLTDVISTGFIEGADWYYAFGSRQDYMNYFVNCREVTLELSSDKLLNSDLLPDHWNYNRDAMITYLKQVQYGIKGIVTDNCTGNPIKAKIEIENHDVDNSFVYSSLPIGNYHRPIYSGTYTVIVSAEGYESQTFNNISINNYNSVVLNVALTPLPPTANFSYDLIDNCLGKYALTNTTTGDNTYLWTFPDGSQSTNTNENITFTENGTYTIELEAINSCLGSNSISQQITLDHLITPPSSNNIERCGPGEVTFSATSNGADNISWYDAENGTLLQTGTTYTTNISNTTTVWVEETGENTTLNGGKLDNSGTGSFYSYSTEQGLIFNCNESVVLKSVKVYANGTENRTIKLVNESSTTLYEQTFSIPDGESRVTLNWTIPTGNNFYLYGPESSNLYRNGGNSAPTLPYPYNIDDIISITGNTANNNKYYYYFYDWEIESQSCSSPQIPITATVSSPAVADFNYSQNGADFSFTNNSTNGTSYYWTFGDGSNSDLENPSHEYSSNGDYLVTLTVTNSCGSIDYSETVNITSINLDSLDKINFNIFPNPVSKQLIISKINKQHQKIEILDFTGKKIYEYSIEGSNYTIDTKTWTKGIYFIKIGNTIRKLIKE